MRRPRTRLRVHWGRVIGIIIVGGLLATYTTWMIAQLPETYPPCVTEDQTAPACIWDAPNRGNGGGHSFIVHDDGSVTYLD